MNIFGRAKCKLCSSVIDLSKPSNCACGEIGCDDQGRLYFRDINNFMPLDDEGGEVQLNVVKAPDRKELTFGELLAEFNILLKKFEELPLQAMTTAVTHFDLYSPLLLVAALFRRLKP